MVQFMSTVNNLKTTVVRRRRRPATISINVKTFWAVFDQEITKDFVIPHFIDKYNHYMNGVNIADQFRNYYTTQRVHLKNWKSL